MSMWAVCVAGMAGGVLAVDGQPGKSLTFLAVFALMLGLTAAWFACSRREELAADRGAVDALAGLGYDRPGGGSRSYAAGAVAGAQDADGGGLPGRHPSRRLDTFAGGAAASVGRGPPGLSQPFAVSRPRPVAGS